MNSDQHQSLLCPNPNSSEVRDAGFVRVELSTSVVGIENQSWVVVPEKV
jgi:hypothetical protein